MSNTSDLEHLRYLNAEKDLFFNIPSNTCANNLYINVYNSDNISYSDNNANSISEPEYYSSHKNNGSI